MFAVPCGGWPREIVRLFLTFHLIQECKGRNSKRAATFEFDGSFFPQLKSHQSFRDSHRKSNVRMLVCTERFQTFEIGNIEKAGRLYQPLMCFEGCARRKCSNDGET
jgi:hypothetical protein